MFGESVLTAAGWLFLQLNCVWMRGPVLLCLVRHESLTELTLPLDHRAQFLQLLLSFHRPCLPPPFCTLLRVPYLRFRWSSVPETDLSSPVLESVLVMWRVLTRK